MNEKTLMIVMFCLLMVVSTFGRDLQNYSTAVEKCKEGNGLASYKHFVNPERRIEDNGNLLGPGKSVWISGNVSFSDMFVRYYGCFKPRDGLRKYNISRNNIHECLEQCSSATKHYIGIGNLCYCMSHSDLRTLEYSSDCRHQFPITNYFPGDDISNGNTEISIDVYHLVDGKSLIWKPITNKNIGQCVYYETNGKDSSYVTGSCYTKETGFICTDSHKHKESCLTSNYTKYTSSNRIIYCYSSEKATWISSFKHCKQNSKNLIGTVKLKINNPYWTGFFRTFNLSDFQDRKFAEESNICLSLLNMNNTLVFDPVDCSLEKGYICEDDISNIEKQTTEPSDESSSLSPTTVEAVHNTKVINLALIIALTILVPFPILICILIGKKIMQNARARQDESRTNYIQDNYPTNIRSNLKPDNMSSNPRNQEAMHKFGNHDVDYDMPSDIVPVSDAVISEYDILGTDLCRQQIKGQSSDMNCYGVHTGIVHEDDTNAYDHLEAHVCKQLQTSTGGIYNKMSAEDDTYNTLKLKDERKTGNPDIHEGNYSTFGKSDLSK